MTEAMIVYENEEAQTTALANIPGLKRDPEAVLAEAQKAAAALKRVVDQKANPVKFNGKTYLDYNDWQTLGMFYGITAKVKAVRPISFDLDEDTKVTGFEADAVALRGGEEIGGVTAMCLSDEPNWRSKPLFQLSSMAQTRASAKALRSVLGGVVVLAGYEATPAEEMVTVGEATSTIPPPQPKTRKPAAPVQVTQANQPTDNVQVLAGFKVVAIEEKSGATWSLTKAVADTGLELSTFDTNLGETLKLAHGTGAKLTATWKREESKKKPGLFNNMILTLEGAEEAAKTPRTIGEIFE